MCANCGEYGNVDDYEVDSIKSKESDCKPVKLMNDQVEWDHLMTLLQRKEHLPGAEAFANYGKSLFKFLKAST